MSSVPVFSACRILVAGDVMLDRYWRGPTQRISPEAPVPVVRVASAEARPGGAANVALNLAALGVQVTLLGVVGRDEPARVLREGLDATGRILSYWVESPTEPTITKLRVLSRNQQVLRLDFEEPLDPDHAFDHREYATRFAGLVQDCDVVLLSDYGKGTLRDAAQLIQMARRAGKPILVDPKGTDYQRYHGASLLTPNVPELEAVVGPCPDEATLVAKGSALVEALDLRALLVTRSEKGMTLISRERPPLHLPTLAREVFDVTGAGDTVIATLAAFVASDSTLEDAVVWANRAAGIVVGKLGTASVSRAELEQAANPSGAGSQRVLDRQALLQWRAGQAARGRRVVMTNGCFDLLHVGHLRYLEEARALGDALIVAVNSDASVRRLKGDSRPLNGEQQRMELLAGLRCVDAVVAFDDDTPAALIAAVLPDVLVKGGDYRIDQIAGADAVFAAGGDVRVLKFHPGYSTSALIQRAQQPPL